MKPAFRILTAILIAAALTMMPYAGAPARAGESDAVALTTALKDLFHQDYAALAEALRPLAEEGDPDAQYQLGLLHQLGRGVRQDFKAAARWYRKAAEQDHAQAQYDLGLMHLKPQGVDRDDAAAAHWVGRAALQRLAQAQCHMGLMCEEGKGVARDYDLAAFWYRRGVEQDCPQAQYGLGLLYYNGLGVPSNRSRAAQWLAKAAAGGHAESQHALGAMYLKGLGVARDPALARKWLTKAAQQGEVEARPMLESLAGRDEDGPPKAGPNPDQAWREARAALDRGDHADLARLVRPLALNGDPAAQFTLGLLHSRGLGVLADQVRAHMWLSLAAAQGDQDAARERDSLAVRMPEARIKRADHLARLWRPLSVPDPLAADPAARSETEPIITVEPAEPATPPAAAPKAQPAQPPAETAPPAEPPAEPRRRPSYDDDLFSREIHDLLYRRPTVIMGLDPLPAIMFIAVFMVLPAVLLRWWIIKKPAIRILAYVIVFGQLMVNMIVVRLLGGENTSIVFWYLHIVPLYILRWGGVSAERAAKRAAKPKGPPELKPPAAPKPAAPPPGFSGAGRVACPDKKCHGVMGPDGKCNVCGRVMSIN